MAAHRTHRTPVVLLTALAALTATALTGCGDDDSPASVISEAASAVESAGVEVTAAVSSLSSEASEAIASATAEAGRRLDEIEGGVDARADVRLGTPSATADGRTTVEVTARNTADSTKSFAVQVDFRGSGGNLLDAVLVTVPDVAAGASGTGTARSTHKLSGEVKTEVARALRY